MIAASRFLDYEPRGEIKRLWYWLQGREKPPPEVVCDGPRGTGKSRAIGEFLWLYTEAFPNSRVLVVRKTRVSLSQSWLVTFENFVLTAAERQQFAKPSREHRPSYIRSNGSEIVLGGMNEPDRVLSQEYDVVYYTELTDAGVTEDEWEKLGNLLRYKHGPFHLLIGDCNPGPPTHWVPKRWAKGTTARIRTYHADNQSLQPEYLARLASQTGVRRKLYFLGEWSAAEGMVWETYDPAVNIIDPPRMGEGGVDYQALGIRWFFASQDWGFTAPGSLSAWGVDGDGRLYRVAQYYSTGKLLAWWAERAVRLYREFNLRAIVCDPSRPDDIAAFNERLALDCKIAGIARAGDNTKASSGKGDLSGLDLVRDGLRVLADGKPRIMFLRDSLRERDAGLDEAGAPCCTEEELPGYVFDVDADGRQLERTDPTCADHGADDTRMACTFAWHTDLSDLDRGSKYAPFTWGRAFELYGIKLPSERVKESRG